MSYSVLSICGLSPPYWPCLSSTDLRPPSKVETMQSSLVHPCLVMSTSNKTLDSPWLEPLPLARAPPARSWLAPSPQNHRQKPSKSRLFCRLGSHPSTWPPILHNYGQSPMVKAVWWGDRPTPLLLCVGSPARMAGLIGSEGARMLCSRAGTIRGLGSPSWWLGLRGNLQLIRVFGQWQSAGLYFVVVSGEDYTQMTRCQHCTIWDQKQMMWPTAIRACTK